MRKNIVLFLLLLFAVPAVAVAEGIVKVIYFVPRDRTIQQDIPAQISTQMKKVHLIFIKPFLISMFISVYLAFVHENAF